jgi:hypothetical protein
MPGETDGQTRRAGGDGGALGRAPESGDDWRREGPMNTARAALIALAGTLLAAGTPAQDPPYKVIVNAANPARDLKKAQVATLFLDRTARWSHGPDGAPVDQSLTSPIREAFSNEVLGRPPVAVQNYWQRRMVEMRQVPPPVKASDAEVIREVEKNKGGIGYVSSGTDLPTTVRALRVVD